MRTLTYCSVAAIASCFAFAAAADCENPAVISVPDGKSATLEQMVAAQGEVKAYQTAMNDFLACLDKELEARGDKATDEYKSLMVTRHNDAVTEMETVAAAFNEQVRAYKAANAAPAQ